MKNFDTDPEAEDPRRRPGDMFDNHQSSGAVAALLRDEGYEVVEGADNVKVAIGTQAAIGTMAEDDPDLVFSTPRPGVDEENENEGMPKEIDEELGFKDEEDETEGGKESTALEVIDAVTNRSPNKLTDVFEVDTDEQGRRLFLGTDGQKHSEPQRAAVAFEDYVKLGPSRTLKKLAEIYAGEHNEDWSYSTSVQYITRKLAQYSTDLDWQNRLQKIESRQTAQVLAHARRTAARRKRVRIGYFQMLMRAGAMIVKRSGILDPKNASLLSQEEAFKHFKDAVKMIDVGAQGEKLELGEALDKIAPPKKLEEMSDAELAEYMEVLRSEMQ